EFIREALKIYDWREDDLIPVRGYLQILGANNNIKPLCHNSIVYSNEEALKQAFMDAMILTLHADIEPEFQEYFQSPDLYGMAINLVKTSMRKRIAIEFDNIQMKKILLDGAIAEALEYKINMKKKYLEPLSKRNDADLKSMFIVLRV
ncbi:7090_t:CDS:2, partial [Racocetra fulgida]